MLLEFEGRKLELQSGETVLECLERNGERVASLCRSGVCQSCLLTALAGEVPRAAQQGLKESWRAQGVFMPCVCRPANDLQVVRCDAVPAYASRVLDVQHLSPRVLRVQLARPEGLRFSAGQFIQLVRPADELVRAYSLASLPDDQSLELHVALHHDGRMSQWLAGAAGAAVQLRGPLGECCHVIGELHRPLLLAGTGTGLAPLWGVSRAALQSGHQGPIHLFHGASCATELYLWRDLQELARSHPQLRIAASIRGGEEVTDARIGTTPLAERVLAEASSLSQPRVYLCGNPEFVRSLRKQLYLDGVPLDRIHADPFVPPAPGH